MPVGTVATITEHFELRTLPEAFVDIRRMTYGEKLERQDEMMTMTTPMGKGKAEDKDLQFKHFSRKMALLDFGKLVVDHNITDASGRKLDFTKQADVLSLDVRIGDEISSLIDKVNAFEETEEVKN